MAGRPASALTKARIELIQAQRDGQELKNAQLRGELVIIEEAERRWSDILRVMRAGLLALPSRVAQRVPHLTRGGVHQGLLRHSAAVKRTAKEGEPNGRNDGEGRDGAGGLVGAPPRSWRRQVRRRA